MNCKPGDMAVIVCGENVGVFVDVLEPHLFFKQAWRVRVHSAVRTDLGNIVGKGEIAGCLDYKLRPIRDPGGDAQDETLSWLPVPSRDEVAA
ncbi:hypothetical protein [Acidovorax sp. LjRoot117]|uniref:hypothetical protein n=1 Tax=Acidovorax sp. LjRoot117 TaxID=3342255 RepID=UPI003ECE209F